MGRKLSSSDRPSLFSPLIDVVLCILGAILILLMAYMYLFRTRDRPSPPPPPLEFVSVNPPPRFIAEMDFVYTFPVVGGSGKRQFTLEAQLPDSVKFDQESGTLFGSFPSSAELRFIEFPAMITVKDHISSDTLQTNLQVYPTAIPYDRDQSPLRLSHQGSVLPEGRIGRQYEFTIGALGGVEPYNWTLDKGKLPGGLQIVNGRLVGAPQTAGEYNFSLVVFTLGGSLMYGNKKFEWESARSEKRIYTLNIHDKLPKSPPIIAPDGMVGERYVATVNLGTMIAGERVQWDLPKAMNLSPVSDGRSIAGEPTAAGKYTLTAAIFEGDRQIAVSHAKVYIAPSLGEPSVGGVVYQIWLGDPAIEFAIPHRGMYEPVTLKNETPLPEGLELTQNGMLKGICKKIGVFEIKLSASDSHGKNAIGAITIRCGPKF